MTTSTKSFSQSLKRLEEINRQLENPDSLDLDQSLQLYEEGIKLYQACQTQLDQAQTKFTELSQKLKNQD